MPPPDDFATARQAFEDAVTAAIEDGSLDWSTADRLRDLAENVADAAQTNMAQMATLLKESHRDLARLAAECRRVVAAVRRGGGFGNKVRRKPPRTE